MTAEAVHAIYTLTDAMLYSLKNAGSTSTREISRWLKLHYRPIYDQYSETLALEGLDARLRLLRKKRAGRGETLYDVYQLCLDFGLPKLDLDEEVSIPLDTTDLLSTACDWVEIDNVTAQQVELHIQMMEVLTANELHKIRDWKTMKDAMLRVGNGSAGIPMHKLREMAKK